MDLWTSPPNKEGLYATGPLGLLYSLVTVFLRVSQQIQERKRQHKPTFSPGRTAVRGETCSPVPGFVCCLQDFFFRRIINPTRGGFPERAERFGEQTAPYPGKRSIDSCIHTFIGVLMPCHHTFMWAISKCIASHYHRPRVPVVFFVQQSRLE